jgi:hypothetical protein
MQLDAIGHKPLCLRHITGTVFGLQATFCGTGNRPAQPNSMHLPAAAGRCMLAVPSLMSSPRVMGMLYMRCRDGGPPLPWLLALKPPPVAMVSARDRLRAP